MNLTTDMSRFTRNVRRTLRSAHLRLIYSSSRTPEENLKSIEEALTRVRKVTSLPPSAPPPPAPTVLSVELPEYGQSVLDLPARDRDPALIQQEINGCKSLLLEIIRRAAYDWVLYRTSRRLLQRKLAEQAYNWLFVEEENSAEWRERMESEKYITSFVAICEALELDPESVRTHIKKLTPKNVMSVGRPAEYRRRDAAPSMPDEAPLALDGRTLDAWTSEDTGED